MSADPFANVLQTLAAAQRDTQAALERRGWREPPARTPARQAQVLQVLIDGRPATTAELLSLADGLQLQPTERDIAATRLAPRVRNPLAHLLRAAR